MLLRAWVAAAALGVLLMGAPAWAEKRVALVVGNSAYRHVPALPNPANDASDMAAALQRLGFGVTRVANASFDEMRRAIIAFGREARGSDIAVVFFAGHGMEVGGDNWLIPVDAELRSDIDAESEAISLRTTILQVTNASRLGLVILDACRNNPFAAKMQSSNARTRTVTRGLARTEPTDNVLVAYAARDGTTANDGSGRNSPFTAALLKHVETPGLEINLLFRNVRDDVMAATRREQQPFVYGSLSRDLIYLKTPAAAPAAPSAAVSAPAAPRPDAALWSAISGSSVAALFEEFIRLYPASPHASEARAKLEALKKTQVAVVAPPVAPVAPPAQLPPSPPVQPAVGVFPQPQGQTRTIKIGVLSDMSSLYADIGGPGSVAAAKLAIADFARSNPGIKVELVTEDHKNRPDVGSAAASRWFDAEQVDAVIDVPNSGVALAVSDVARQKNKVVLLSGAAASDLTGARCNANTVHWTYDTWMLTNGIGQALTRSGGDTWFFLTADYAFGHAIERDTSAVVEKSGGKVLGKVRAPLNTSDFASFLLQAQSSKAKVIGLANAGGDTINSIKQASEFGLVTGGQRLAGLLVFASDITALGLRTAQGLSLVETWYWDMNDSSRAWTRRWQAERAAAGKIPTMVHAGAYAGTLHYLKARASLGGSPNGNSVVERMKAMPTDDGLFGKGMIRPDGRKIHDAYLFEVKPPAESKHAGDIYRLRATIPAAEAFRPLRDGGCALVKG